MRTAKTLCVKLKIRGFWLLLEKKKTYTRMKIINIYVLIHTFIACTQDYVEHLTNYIQFLILCLFYKK